MVATYLDDIVSAHRRAARADRRDVGSLVEAAAGVPTSPRGFAGALSARRRVGRLAVIAEVKRRSPSKGAIDTELDPGSVAGEYQQGGAACLSVLTDADAFGGSPDDLVEARAAVQLPVLRKDFTVCAADVADARLMGADAVLLIVAALDGRELAELSALASRLGLDALVEVHDEAELAMALDVGARLVGVNRRDLTTFEVDPERAVRVARAMPADVVAVAESGIRGPGDAAVLGESGYDGVLVGESLVRAADRTAATAALASVVTVPRRTGGPA